MSALQEAVTDSYQDGHILPPEEEFSWKNLQTKNIRINYRGVWSGVAPIMCTVDRNGAPLHWFGTPLPGLEFICTSLEQPLHWNGATPHGIGANPQGLEPF